MSKPCLGCDGHVMTSDAYLLVRGHLVDGIFVADETEGIICTDCKDSLGKTPEPLTTVSYNEIEGLKFTLP